MLGRTVLRWQLYCRIRFSHIQLLSICDVGGTSPAITPDLELSGYYLVNHGGTTITAVVTMRVEGVCLVYVAYSGAIAVVSYSVLLVCCDHILIQFTSSVHSSI